MLQFARLPMMSMLNDDLFFLRKSSDSKLSFDIEVREKDGEIVIYADLPGVKKEDINVTLENEVLTISAERKKKEEDGVEYIQERSFGSFRRILEISSDIDDVHAAFQNGVLKLILNRKKEAKPRKVPIS